MAELGLAADDYDKVRSIGGGAFCRVEDAGKIRQTFADNAAALKQALEDDKFCAEAIEYELANHEYIVTYDPREALDALGLSLDDKRVRKLFQLARERYMERMKEWI